MHRIAVGAFAGFAALAGCLGERTKTCANGATCPFDEACTELALDAPRLCGPERLVEQCRAQPEYTTCDFQGPADGTCLSGVCSECTANTAGCVSAGWTAMTSGSDAELLSVWPAGPAEAYAVGEQSTLLRYDGFAWAPVSLAPTTIGSADPLLAVWGDRTGLFVTSSGGRVLRGVEAAGVFTWTEQALNGQLLALGGSGPTDVVAVGADGTAGAIFEYDGTSWTRATLPVTTPPIGILKDVWVDDAQTAWAVGNQGVILRRDGATWSVSQAPVIGAKALNGVWGTATRAFAAGDAPDAITRLILELLGGTWMSAQGIGTLPATNYQSVWGLDQRVYIVGEVATVVRLDPPTWSRMEVTVDAALNSVRGTDPANVLAVGASGTILRYTGRD